MVLRDSPAAGGAVHRTLSESRGEACSVFESVQPRELCLSGDGEAIERRKVWYVMTVTSERMYAGERSVR